MITDAKMLDCNRASVITTVMQAHDMHVERHVVAWHVYIWSPVFGCIHVITCEHKDDHQAVTVVPAGIVSCRCNLSRRMGQGSWEIWARTSQ